MLLKEAFTKGKSLLTLPQVNSSLEIRLLLQYILDISEVDFLANYNASITSQQYLELTKLISLRNTGLPLAYIVGYKYFWKNKFLVNNSVLIPREESELLIEVILNLCKNNLNIPYNILELGVGSGCILASLLKEFPHAYGVGVDICKKALLVAKNNFNQLNINHKRWNLLQQNLFNGLSPKNNFNIIVSNPPYIDSEDKLVQEEVKKFEPQIALFAKNKGLYFYEQIFKNAKYYLTLPGFLVLEVGIGQKEDVVNLSKQSGLIFKSNYKDTLGIDRVLVFGNNN